MALDIPCGIFHLAWLLYVRLETFGPYYICACLYMNFDKLGYLKTCVKFVGFTALPLLCAAVVQFCWEHL
jgi:hypothetical protein